MKIMLSINKKTTPNSYKGRALVKFLDAIVLFSHYLDSLLIYPYNS